MRIRIIQFTVYLILFLLTALGAVYLAEKAVQETAKLLSMRAHIVESKPIR